MPVDTIDPSNVRIWGEPVSFMDVDEVETTTEKRWTPEEKPRPMENLRFEAFQVLTWLAILCVTVYAVLLSIETVEMKDFATIVVAPIITILASAAGYYFGGSRTSQRSDDQARREDASS